MYVRAFPRGDRKLLVSTGGGTHPLWPRAGNELFYWNGVRMTSVAIETPDLRLGTPVEIFQDTWDRSSEEALSRAYDYDAVGQRFLMARLAGEPVARQINVVLNWAEELTERVPVD